MLKGLAALAQLDLDPAESARMKRDLDAILGYAAKLDELDTEDVPPTAHVLEIDTPVREDEVSGAILRALADDRERPVRVLADDASPLQAIATVLAALERAGAEDVGLALATPSEAHE